MPRVSKSQAEWKQDLTPEQYAVLREKATEAPFSGALLNHHGTGIYQCAACGEDVFSSESKFDSTTPGLIGWPSFTTVKSNDAIKLVEDRSLSGEHRLEVVCRTCGSHLGHLFPDDSSPNGQHYCINSLSLQFKKAGR